MLIAGALVVAGAGGAAACKLTSLDCGMRASPSDAVSTELADGLQQDVVVSGVREPTDVGFLPDGRILISQRDGLVRVAAPDGRLEPQHFLDLRDRVNTAFFRGLMAIQVDPAFARNGFLYALYVREDDSGPAEGPRTVRLSRFTVRDGRADAASERVLLGRDGRGSCGDLPRGSDCLPSDVDHDGGDIEFARDGTMFVATGDGGGKERVEATAFSAQDPGALGGKVLRITRNGRGLRDNPWATGDLRANRSKVWAMGFRNPFRMALRPGSETPYVGDVGWVTAEEIAVAPRGSNNGWPCFEGRERQPVYAKTALCRRMYERGATAARAPVDAYGRDVGATIVLGGFLSGPSVPRERRGMLVYGDFVAGWIRGQRLDDRGRRDGQPVELASSAGAPSTIVTAPDGGFFYLSYSTGELRRVHPPE